jgi:excisionase family DNA binding protein
VNDPQPEFLTVAEVAARLRINQQTVRNWIDRKALAAVRVGQRRLRIRQADLDAFLAAGATEVVAEINATPPEGVDTNAVLWARLGTAMTKSSNALAEQDTAELIDALRMVADAATVLADALDTNR